MDLIKKIDLEKLFFCLLGLSFFIGIWHAFPMFNVIGDEMYYVGGVLRALENHTIFPISGDVPYGTLTYLINYILTFLYLGILLPFFKFSLVGLKLYLVSNPTLMYLSRRFLSGVFAVVMVYFINKLFTKEVEDKKTRLYLLLILFTNLITATVLHTGKMWVLSTLLVIVSFYYLKVSIEGDFNRRNVFLSILFSFLALSNFPLNFYSLINIPILLYVFKNEQGSFKNIIKYSSIGFLAFLFVTLINYAGIRDQIISIFTVYHPINTGVTSNLNFFTALRVYVSKALFLYPIIILTLLVGVHGGIKNRKLFTISSLYFVSYFLLIVLVANWSTDLKTDLRYLFPLAFFLVFAVSGLNIKFNKLFYVLGLVSSVFYVFLLYYLSIPTTYNYAYDWVVDNLGDKQVVVENKIAELQLKKNNQSSLITKDESCATKCKTIISFDLNSNFKPVVVDLLSKNIDLASLNTDVYYIYEKPIQDSNFELVTKFDNTSRYYHSVEYNVGTYFDPTFFGIKNFGKNIYIYKLSKRIN